MSRQETNRLTGRKEDKKTGRLLDREATEKRGVHGKQMFVYFTF